MSDLPRLTQLPLLDRVRRVQAAAVNHEDLLTSRQPVDQAAVASIRDVQHKLDELIGQDTR